MPRKPSQQYVIIKVAIEAGLPINRTFVPDGTRGPAKIRAEHEKKWKCS